MTIQIPTLKMSKKCQMYDELNHFLTLKTPQFEFDSKAAFTH